MFQVGSPDFSQMTILDGPAMNCWYSKQWFGWCSEPYIFWKTPKGIYKILYGMIPCLMLDSTFPVLFWKSLSLANYWGQQQGKPVENENTTFPLPETKWCPAIGKKNSLADGELSPLRHDQQEIRWWNSNLKWMHLDNFLLIATSEDLNDFSLLKVHGFETFWDSFCSPVSEIFSAWLHIVVASIWFYKVWSFS